MIEERRIIEQHFVGRIGRFLELGAHDGITDSLTAGLVANGWHGVQVEANPQTFLKLQENHEANERLELVNVAVGSENGLCKFFSQHGGSEAQESTLSGDHKRAAENRGFSYRRPHWVSVATVADLLAQFGNEFQFVIIDIEGMTFHTARQFPWKDMPKTSLVCVELTIEIANKVLGQFYECRKVGTCNVIGVRK